MKSASKARVVIISSLAVFAAVPAAAHGPQMQIDIENDRIVTRHLFPDGPYEPAETPIQRIYEIPLAQRTVGDASDGWYAQPNAAYPFTGPGIATWGGGFATGAVVNLMVGDGLKLWNGSMFIDPGDEQMDGYRGATRITGAITTDTGPFNSFSFTPITNAEDEHKTGFFRLLGDGVSSDAPSDDGVYLLTLRLATDQPGIAASDPYYFLLSKNAQAVEQAAAVAYINSTLIPEPAGLALWGLVGMMLRRR